MVARRCACLCRTAALHLSYKNIFHGCRLSGQAQRGLRALSGAQAESAPALEVNVSPASFQAAEGCPRGAHWQVSCQMQSATTEQYVAAACQRLEVL